MAGPSQGAGCGAFGALAIAVALISASLAIADGNTAVLPNIFVLLLIGSIVVYADPDGVGAWLRPAPSPWFEAPVRAPQALLHRLAGPLQADPTRAPLTGVGPARGEGPGRAVTASARAAPRHQVQLSLRAALALPGGPRLRLGPRRLWSALRRSELPEALQAAGVPPHWRIEPRDADPGPLAAAQVAAALRPLLAGDGLSLLLLEPDALEVTLLLPPTTGQRKLIRLLRRVELLAAALEAAAASPRPRAEPEPEPAPWPVLARGAPRTCLYCKDPLDGGEPVTACAGCGTPLHAACRSELEVCPVLGCGARQARSPRRAGPLGGGPSGP